MANFSIKRLQSEQEDNARLYHLFDKEGSLKLVADYGSPWLAAEDSDRYVRFAESTGKIIAQMDLAATATKMMGGHQSKDYAIVLNHAVYAILSEHHAQEDGVAHTYFVLRVAENVWLALKEETNQPYFTLYDEVPASLISRSMEPIYSDLPDPVGEINRGVRQYDYTVAWQAEIIKHLDVLIMALVFLIDRMAETA